MKSIFGSIGKVILAIKEFQKQIHFDQVIEMASTHYELVLWEKSS